MIAIRRSPAARRATAKLLSVSLLLVAAVAVIGCNSTDSHPLCQSIFNSKSSPTTGVVIANGTFAEGESILLMVPVNGQTQTFVGTTSPDGLHATFTGVPSGHYDSVTWVASCKNGELTLHTGNLDVT